MTKVWLKGEFEFATLFSYRIPNFSTAYAPSSPMPGPSAVKLALVATRIELTGQPSEGTVMFDVVKAARVGLEPPPWVAISRTFLRRLKRMKAGNIDQSFGIREYVHHGGTIGLYLEIEADAVGFVAHTMRQLRRIGTTDSVLYCLQVTQTTPNPALIAQPLAQEFFQVTLNPELLRGRPVLPLRDIKPNSTFKQANPYEGSGSFTEQQMYIFPLRLYQAGDGWTHYQRESFEGFTY